MEQDPRNSKTKNQSKTSYVIPVTIVAISGFVLLILNTQFDRLNETINLNPGVRGISNFAVPALASILCGLFLVIFRRGGWRTLIGLLLILIPFLTATLVQPVFDGDGQIVRTQFRFQNQLRQWQTATNTAPKIDLVTTTPHDYPRFLGPGADATIDDVELSSWQNNPPETLWKQPIGDGWSGFAVVNGKAITQEQRDDQECVTCYDLQTGVVLWMACVQRRHEDLAGMGKPGPRATPTIDEGRVYAMSATGILDCLAGEDGSLLWSADVPEMVGIGQKYSINSTGQTYSEETSTLAWGRAGSPLIYKNLVIVPGGRMSSEEGGGSAATLIAFDKQSGEVRWRGGERMIAYGSPIIATLHGKPHIVLIAEDHAVGHDPETGKELWAHPRPGNSNMAANCSQVTPISDTQLVFSKGYGAGGELVEVVFDAASKTYSVKSVRKDSRILKTKLTSPIVYQDHLFSLSDGYLECVAIEGLKRKWKKRGRFGNGQILRVGDKLLVHSEQGVLHLVRADAGAYKEVGKVKTIEGVCWNTLCFSKNLLLVRSELEAACLRLPAALIDATATTDRTAAVLQNSQHAR